MLASSYVLGSGFLGLLSERLTSTEISALAFPVGSVLHCISIFAVQRFLGSTKTNYWIQVTLGFGIGGVFLLKMLAHRAKTRMDRSTRLALLCVSAAISYLYVHFLYQKNSYVSIAVRNDMALEIGMIQSFHLGCNERSSAVNVQNVLVSGASGFFDSFPAIYCSLLRVNLSLRKTIVVVSVSYVFSIVFGVYCLAMRVIDDQALSIMAIPAVFFIGGFGFRRFFDSSIKAAPPYDYVFGVTKDKYTNWANPFMHLFLSSRTALLSLSLSVLALLLSYSGEPIKSLVPIALCFLVRYQSAHCLLVMIAVQSKSIVVIAIAVLLQSRQVFSPAWSTTGIVKYITDNSGLFFIPALLDFKHMDLLSAVVAFVVYGYTAYQPIKRYDFISYLTVLFPVFIVCSLRAFKKLFKPGKEEFNGLIYSVAFSMVLVHCFSTVAGIANYWKRMEQIWTPEEKILGRWILKNTNSTDVFATTFDSLNPAVFRAGRINYFGNKFQLHSSRYENGNRGEEIAGFLDRRAQLPVKYFVSYSDEFSNTCGMKIAYRSGSIALLTNQ